MMTAILRYREWSRLETIIVLSLLVLFVSEMAVLLLLEHGPGDSMAGFFGAMASWAAGVLVASARWIYRMVGPMIFPLFILTVVEGRALAKLLRIRRIGPVASQPETQYKALKIVEGAAPGFGFLGTCLSLISTMQHMDPGLDQTAMLKTLLDNSASAFGSTVYGTSLAIGAFLSLSLFKDFLIEDQIPKPEQTAALKLESPLTVALKKEVEDARDFRS